MERFLTIRICHRWELYHDPFVCVDHYMMESVTVILIYHGDGMADVQGYSSYGFDVGCGIVNDMTWRKEQQQ